MRKIVHRATRITLLLLLAGCMSDTGNVFRNIHQQGNPEEELYKLSLALQQDPSNPELRVAYLTLREQILLDWLEQGHAATARADPTSAESYYRRVLRLEPGNERARNALQALSRETRYRTLLKEATEEIAAKNLEAAALKLRMALAERPNDPDANQLLASLEEDRAASSGPKLSPSLQKRVSIQFRDATVKQIFDVLSAEAGFNFVFDKDVKTDAMVNIALRDVTVKEALDTVLNAAQLESNMVSENSFLIYPNTPAKLRDYKVLVVKAFFLSNANVEEVANTLRAILKVRDIVADKSKNLLIIRDTPEAVRIAEKLVRLQDLASPEVMIEVEVLEVNRNRLAELGINLPGQLTLSPLSSATGGTLTLRELLNINAATTAATISPLVINANATDTDIKVLANPRIRAKDRETAKILIGDRVPNITSTATSTGFVSSNVQYIDVGLKLEITPAVSIEGEISMRVALEVSSISNQITTQSGTVAYQIGTRTASTVLRLRDGENQILAGLLSNEDRLTSNRLPGISDLPLIGRLFTNRRTDLRKNEIILSITPRILRNTPRQTLAALEFDSGSEGKLRNAPASAPPPSSASTAPAAAMPSGTIVTAPLALAPPPSGPAASGPVTSYLGQSYAASPQPTAREAGQTFASPAAVAATGAPLSTAVVNVGWLGPNQVKAGDTFQLQLQIGASQPIKAATYTISLDPSVLEVTSVSEGDFFRQAGGQTLFSPHVDRSTGQVVVSSALAESDNKPGAAGTGALMILTLQARSASGGTNVQVSSMASQSGPDMQVNVAPPPFYTIIVAP